MLCHVTAGGGLGGGFSGPTPVRVVYQPPPWVQMTTPAPPSEAEKGPEDTALPQRVNSGKHAHTSSAELLQVMTSCRVNSAFLPQWITTLISSSTCPEATWTCASTSTPNPATSSTWFLTVEQVPKHLFGAIFILFRFVVLKINKVSY